ncbi:hypothetical protein OQY15_18925 [Pedobacter sp. MC2016-15]|uniref:MSCRAMM family protein n=1 Tax=Pedobacter sp. MC2016-15 TaxID=2994473 RepID=UPI0022479CD1|nr:SdrD B-like domain-containing protein [Pedobacter sp. MC2016-15]MCX2481186.1 hypothetical protein [Pedobacter sp. MC2016-15]
MYPYRYWKLLCLLLCFQLAAYKASAQVKYAFTQDTLLIKGGTTFANLLRLSNPYAETVTLVQNPSEKKLTKGLISLPDTLVLQGGQTRAFPLKYVADRQTININSQEFKVSLVALKAGLQVQKSALFITQLTEVKGLTIGTETDEVYLSQLSNQAQVMVRVANNSFVPLRFRLALSGVPDGLEFIGQTMNLTLAPGAQQLLPFLARNKTVTRVAPDFTVTIDALDDRNTIIATKMIRILNVTSSTRSGQGNDQFLGPLPNAVALRYASLSNDYSFYQLQANGNMNLGENTNLQYRANVDRITQGNKNGLNIYNSYLNLDTKYFGVRLGNIYENMDFQLSGRGAKVKANLKKAGVLSLYGIENQYMLYDQINTTFPSARIYALDYNLESVNQAQRLTAMHKHDPYTGLDAKQASWKGRFKLSKTQSLGLEGGYSTEKLYDLDTEVKKGYSAGLNYFLNTEDFAVNANGYYSSPYFTGIRRGQLNSELRLQRKFSQFSSLSVRGSVQMNKPRFQDLVNNDLNNTLNLGINKNAVYIYEVAYAAALDKFHVSGGPYYMGQQLSSSGYSASVPEYTDWKASSVRFSANLGYGGRLQGFDITADYGYTYLNTSQKPPAPFHSLKVTGSYTLPIVGFSGYAQLNPFYLSDVISYTPGTNYRIYSFGPNIHFTALKEKLNFRGSGMYNYYGFSKSSNYSATGSMRYMMKGNWAFTADVQYTLTKQVLPSDILNNINAVQNGAQPLPGDLRYNNRQVRVGVEKQFGRSGQHGSEKLELTYYEDHNNNGRRDTGEPAVPGVLVKINGDAALTNANGQVVFKDMRKEAYAVNITNTKGWSLQEPTSVFLNKSKKLDIPLVKTQALNGCLKVKEEKYAEGKPLLSGLKVNAVDANGQVHETLTDENGKFCFYLPRSKYSVYIETAGLPFSIENAKQEVLLQGTPVEMLTFIYKDQHRKIGVKRF